MHKKIFEIAYDESVPAHFITAPKVGEALRVDLAIPVGGLMVRDVASEEYMSRSAGIYGEDGERLRSYSKEFRISWAKEFGPERFNPSVLRSLVLHGTEVGNNAFRVDEIVYHSDPPDDGINVEVAHFHIEEDQEDDLDVDLTIRQFAGRIIHKVIAAAEEDMGEVRLKWLNEYAECLEIIFPNMSFAIHRLQRAVEHLEEGGIRITMNIHGKVCEESDQKFFIEED